MRSCSSAIGCRFQENQGEQNVKCSLFVGIKPTAKKALKSNRNQSVISTPERPALTEEKPIQHPAHVCWSLWVVWARKLSQGNTITTVKTASKVKAYEKYSSNHIFFALMWNFPHESILKDIL